MSFLTVRPPRRFGLIAFTFTCSIAAMGCGGDPGEQAHDVIGDELGEPEIEIVGPGLVKAPNDDLDLMMEEEACTVIVQTYGAHGLDIGCPTTIKACPGLFRDSFGIACMQYESNSIAACLDNIEASTSCDEIRDTTCEVAPVWGSEPLGCGEPF
jgi:hypothetical protein